MFRIKYITPGKNTINRTILQFGYPTVVIYDVVCVTEFLHYINLLAYAYVAYALSNLHGKHLVALHLVGYK